MPGNVHELKERVVARALAAAGFATPGTPPPHAARASAPGREPAPLDRPAPLDVAAAVGDPMQPFVAGLALAAHRHLPVVLAGGSQMAAVLALALHHARYASLSLDPDQLAVVTTGWVARDPAADLAGLARDVMASARDVMASTSDVMASTGDSSGTEAETLPAIPFLASDVSFAHSRHPSMRRYEQFLVKEGVGAGAALVAAALRTSANRTTLVEAVEAVYDDIYGDGGGDGGGDPQPADAARGPDTISR